MLKLRAVQARYGDCLILEHGTSKAKKYVLIDGGPSKTYEDHLRDILKKIDGGELELCVLSHVDTDHVTGLVDLFAELRDEQANGGDGVIEIAQFWHNSFGRAVGNGAGAAIPQRLKTAFVTANPSSQAALESLLGVIQGSRRATSCASWRGKWTSR